MWSCSSDEGEDPDEPLMPEMMRKFDISEADTAGLRIFGYAGVEKENMPAALLGNKNGHLWVHFVKDVGKDNSSEIIFKKLKTIVFKSQFNDKRTYDLGYGEVTTTQIHYITFDEFYGYHSCLIGFHDENNFSLTTTGSHFNETLSWIVYNGEVMDSPHFFNEKFSTGYKGWYWYRKDYNECQYIFNEKGEALYPYYDHFADVTFININEYLNVHILANNYTISLCDASKYSYEKEFIIWSHSEKLGSVIDNHDPRIEYTAEHNTDIITCTLKVTNYDGTKEEKIIKLNVADGTLAY